MNPMSAPTPVGDVRWRDISTIEGTIRSLRVRLWADSVPSLECTVLDESGGIELVFLGRQRLGGVHLGAGIRAFGRVGAHHGRLAILNPVYELLAPEVP